MRLLVVSFFYAPANVVGATRVVSFADYSHSMGDDVRVISGALAGVSRSLPTAIPEAAIQEVGWFDPRRLRYQSSSRMPAVVRQDSETTGAVPRGQRRAYVRSHLKKLHKILSSPDWAAPWIRPAVRSAHSSTTLPPTVILASGPPFSAMVVARKLSKLWGVPWVADLRDPWANPAYGHTGALHGWLDVQRERRTLASADAVVTVSRLEADRLARRIGKPVGVVQNGYSRLAREMSPRKPIGSARLNVLYVGNSLYGGLHDPSPLFKSIERLGLQPQDVQVHFLGTDPRAITSLEAAKPVRRHLVFHPAVSHAESLQYQERADLLLLLLQDGPRADGVYSAKLYEYIGARRPVLLIGNTSGVAAELLRKRSLGFVPTDGPKLDSVVREGLAGFPRWNYDEESVRDLSRASQNERLRRLLVDVSRDQRASPL